MGEASGLGSSEAAEAEEYENERARWNCCGAKSAGAAKGKPLGACCGAEAARLKKCC
jgi:hypothetical protein